MKRLTHQGEHGPYWDKAVFDKHGGMEEDLIIDRLAYYEDMEEQGRLVVLEKKEHQADVLQYYKHYRDRLERYEQALKGGVENGDRSD